MSSSPPRNQATKISLHTPVYSMKSLVVLISTFAIILVTCYASLPSAELYWHSMLPNTTLPKAIHDRLLPATVEDWGVKKIHPDMCLYYAFIPLCITSTVNEKNDPRRYLFFTENDLKVGAKKDLYLIKSSNRANFLPHKVNDLNPFTSKNITMSTIQLLAQPNSLEAKDMRNTIQICGASSEMGEESSCATSLEDMIDFTISRLGKNIEPLTSEADQVASVQSYVIVDLKNMKNQRSVVCHKLTYPYAVYKCHSVSSTRTYKVSLATTYGRKINVAVVCHIDTSRWSPEHLAFDVLKIKPGTVPVCHIVPEDHIVWVPNELSK